MVLGSVGSLATPYVLKIIIDDIFPSGNFKDLIHILLGLLGIYILRIFFAMLSQILNSTVSQKIVSDIRKDMLSNILDKPIGFFKHAKHGDIIYTLTNDVHVIHNALSGVFLNFLNDSFTIIGIVVMLSILNLKLTLYSLTIIPFIIFSIKWFTPLIQRNFRFVQEEEGSLSGFFLEKLRNIRVVKSYDTNRFEQEKLKSISSNLIRLYKTNAILTSLNSNIITFLAAIGPVIALIFGGHDVFSKAITIGSLIAFIQYLNRLYAPVINVMNNYNELLKSVVSMERVINYIYTDKSETTNNFRDVGSVNLLKLKDVSLSIDQIPILHSVNMEFKKGKIYALKGESGSGKSSIINLICGFLKPDSGEIVVNQGVAIEEIKNWKSFLGLIEKENQLFNDSIFANVRYGSFEMELSDLEMASTHAMLTPVIEKIPHGGATQINETGTLLSDGQKQRIAIARALLKKPGILLIDEATSCLDIATEKTIVANLREHYSQSIIIIVTHRKESVEMCDYVYEVSNGRILNDSFEVLEKNQHKEL